MSRQTNFIGFNERCRKFAQDNLLESYFEILLDPIEGMFGEVAYTTKGYVHNNTKRLEYKEYLQDEPWSSGPCIFMALWDCQNNKPVTETLWTDKEIEEWT